jgi:CBS domain-containing protein
LFGKRGQSALQIGALGRSPGPLPAPRIHTSTAISAAESIAQPPAGEVVPVANIVGYLHHGEHAGKSIPTTLKRHLQGVSRLPGRDRLPEGNDVWSVGTDTSVFEAIELMSDKGIGALVVLEDDKLVGIISERDYARKVVLKERASKQTRVGEIMTKEILYARPDHTVQEGLALMTEKRIRHLPVLDDDKLVGMISIGDLVKSIIDEQQQLIQQLEHYISG